MSKSRRHVEPKVRDALRELCGVIAHDVRRGILWSLLEGPCDVSTLAKQHGSSIALISNSLRMLKEANLVQVERDSQRRIYSLSGKVRVLRTKSECRLVLEAEGGSTVTLSAPHPLPPARRRASARPS